MIEEFCENDGTEFRDYSGRFMYGKRCTGIVCSNPLETLMSLMGYLIDYCGEPYDEMRYQLGDPQFDSMGLDFILYFPKVKCD